MLSDIISYKYIITIGDEYSLSNDAIADWAKKMADSWLNFGIALGFSKEDLQTIKDLNDTGYSNSNEVCCSAMLYRWMETGDQREKTHERLLRAAKEANPLVVTNGMCPEPPPYSGTNSSNTLPYNKCRVSPCTLSVHVCSKPCRCSPRWSSQRNSMRVHSYVVH